MSEHAQEAETNSVNFVMKGIFVKAVYNRLSGKGLAGGNGSELSPDQKGIETAPSGALNGGRGQN